MLRERVARFLADPGASGASFEELALAAFAFQHERIDPYRRLCAARGVSPATVSSWLFAYELTAKIKSPKHNCLLATLRLFIFVLQKFQG